MRQVRTLTDQAEQLLAAGKVAEALQTVRRAGTLGLNEGRTWHVLARALEAEGDHPAALAAYEQALEIGVAAVEVSGGMARVLLRLGEYARAEGLLTLHLQSAPPTADAVADLAQAQTRLGAIDRAHETLKTALEADPGEPLLWFTLAQLLSVHGRHAHAVVFFEECLRLEPGAALAQAGLAEALLTGAGDIDRALSLSADALAAAPPAILPAITDAHARRLLAAGQLKAGWDAFARGVEPGPAALVQVRVAAPPWTDGAPLAGPLLLIGEDGVADELLLAHVVPSLVAEGRPLILAVSESWAALARRSFPRVSVVPLLSRDQAGRRLHAAGLDGPLVHGGEAVAAWTPLRSTLAGRRGTPSGFGAGPYLKSDLGRVCYWRERIELLGTGPKVGVLWRARNDPKAWEAPPLAALAAPLSVEGVHFISLQHEEAEGELDWIEETFGPTIYPPPTDLSRENLDDLAAFARALDVVIGPPDVATYLAAACGAETWFLSTPNHWAKLGADAYPWFPQARVISAAAPDDWTDAMAELGEALAALAGATRT